MELVWIRSMLVRDLEGIKRELAAYPDEQSLWIAPPAITNAAGNLALHCAGNIRHFIGAMLGKSGYVRNRDREFAARGIPRADIQAELDQAIAIVRQTLGPGASIDLNADFPETVGGRFRVNTGEWLVHLVAHLAFHLGQVGYLRRIVTGDAKSAGAMAIGDLSSARRLEPA